VILAWIRTHIQEFWLLPFAPWQLPFSTVRFWQETWQRWSLFLVTVHQKFHKWAFQVGSYFLGTVGDVISSIGAWEICSTNWMMDQIRPPGVHIDSMLRMLWLPVINKWQPETADSQIMMYNCNRPRGFFFKRKRKNYLPTCAGFKATERRQRRIFASIYTPEESGWPPAQFVVLWARVLYHSHLFNSGVLVGWHFCNKLQLSISPNDSHQTCYCVNLSFIEVLVIWLLMPIVP